MSKYSEKTQRERDSEYWLDRTQALESALVQISGARTLSDARSIARKELGLEGPVAPWEDESVPIAITAGALQATLENLRRNNPPAYRAITGEQP